MRVLERSGLLLTRLRWDEWLILALFASLVAWPRMLAVLVTTKSKLELVAAEEMAVFVGFGVGLFTVACSPGTRFRNLYFSLGWLALSVWLLLRSKGLAIEPLVLFGFYHGVRWHFWRRYQRELIPASVSRTGYDRDYYRVEKRFSSFEDIRYTKFLFRVGMMLFFASFLLPLRTVENPNCKPPCLYMPTSKP